MRRQILVVISILLVGLATPTEVVCHAKLPPWRQKFFWDVSDRQVLVRTIYEGVVIIMDKKDKFMTYYVRKDGTYEPLNMRTFARFVKPGNTIINVGANIGLETIVYGKIVGPTGKIFFFEPYSKSYNMLMKNIYINELEDITTLNKVAISNIKQKAYILVDYNNISAAQIHTEETAKNYKGQLSEKEQIQIDLLDNVLPKDLKVDFALIDVERVQIQCLEGMKEVVMRSPDLIMVVQWAGYSTQIPYDEYLVRMKALLEWFSSHQYRFYRIERDETLRSADKCIKEKFTVMNVQQTYDHTLVIKKTGLIDLIFAPEHIDPNTLQ